METTLTASKTPAKNVGAAAAKGKTASETYRELSQLEHVLKRPDTYIGSVEAVHQPMWVFDKEKQIMVNKRISFVPGLYKIVDEILVDNKQRDDTMDTLKVTIDSQKNTISVMNNGKGIPVETHETEKIYIPELIFGHLLAGSNFDDEEKKTTGGRNGYGAKLANIYSTEFIVEVADKQTEDLLKIFVAQMGGGNDLTITLTTLSNLTIKMVSAQKDKMLALTNNQVQEQRATLSIKTMSSLEERRMWFLLRVAEWSPRSMP